MSTCKLCKKALQTAAEEVRGDVCFKCIPNGVQIMWTKNIYDEQTKRYRWIVRTKEIVRRRVTNSLFQGYQPQVQDVYRYKKYVSK